MWAIQPKYGIFIGCYEHFLAMALDPVVSGVPVQSPCRPSPPHWWRHWAVCLPGVPLPGAKLIKPAYPAVPIGRHLHHCVKTDVTFSLLTGPADESPHELNPASLGFAKRP
jgi:hypothetical protein